SGRRWARDRARGQGQAVRADVLDQAARQRPGAGDRQPHRPGAPGHDPCGGQPAARRALRRGAAGLSREAILVVDDEAGVRASLSGILGDEGYRVDAVESGEAGLQALESREYDLLLLDVWLPQMDGIEVLSRVRALDPDLPVVVISG